MPESTMICLDNSEWMRNGDYSPNRLEAQQDAAQKICSDKTMVNPENTVGILTTAGQSGVELLASPTEDIGKLLGSFSKIKIGGTSSFICGIRIAQLALKHRRNKNATQRIVAFVGSPITDDILILQKIGKELRKNNIGIDVVSLGGNLDGNNEKLSEFVQATNSNNNCHFITVPPGVSPLDAIISSPILEGSFTSGGGTGGGNFMSDDNDADLALALRMSTEEARYRAQNADPSSSSTASGDATGATANDTTMSGFGGYGAMDAEDEEALLQQALEMSMRDLSTQEAAAATAASSSSSSNTNNDSNVNIAQTTTAAEADDEDDEEAALQAALALSMAEATTATTPPPPPAAVASSTSMPALDADFVNQLLGSVNVDPNDALIQAALAQLLPNSGSNSNSSSSSNDNDSNKEDSKKRKTDD